METMSKRAVALAVIILLGTAGCSEEPTVGNSLVADLPLADLLVRDTMLTATRGSSALTVIPMNGPLNLLGSSEGFTAAMALQFFPSLFPPRDTALVFSATLRMHAVTWMGDSAGQLGFTVHRITRGWSQASMTTDSVTAGFYEEGVVRGTYTGGAAPDTHIVAVSLDTAMVRLWLQTPTATTDTKYGIYLLPAAGTTILRGFIGFDIVTDSLRPQLTIIAGNVAGTSRDTSYFTLGTDTFFGSVTTFTPDPDRLVTRAGLAIRSSLVFDLTGIPRGAIVNKADLLLQRDPADSRLTRFSGDSLVSAHVLLSESDLSLFESDRTSSPGGRKDGTPYTVSIDLRHATQAWLRGPNYGLLLRVSSASEFSSADSYAFFSPQAADSTLRPRLRVVYASSKL